MNHRHALSKFLPALTSIVLLGAVAAPALADDDGVVVTATSAQEAVYVAKIRDVLIRGMRYPTGREASLTQPEGKVSVWFALRHDGSVVARGIRASSGSTLLDDQARRLVGRARFPSMPDESWTYDGDRGYVATYRFDNRSETDLGAVSVE